MKKAIPGKITIEDKVYFEYYLLEKPNKDHYWQGRNFVKKTPVTLDEALKEYEASKQLIEVSNWLTIDNEDKNCSLLLSKTSSVGKYAWDGDFCKAEITNNTATIVELL